MRVPGGEERLVLAVAFGCEPLDGDEAERRGVDAVPLPRRTRTVVEDVPQVRANLSVELKSGSPVTTST
jgi:hypothetical protein